MAEYFFLIIGYYNPLHLFMCFYFCRRLAFLSHSDNKNEHTVLAALSLNILKLGTSYKLDPGGVCGGMHFCPYDRKGEKVKTKRSGPFSVLLVWLSGFLRPLTKTTVKQ